MGMSTFPNGFPNGVSIRGIPLQQAYSGQVYWVNGSSVLPPNGIAGSNGNKGTYLQPFATLDYAVGRCTAGRGDIIMVMPSHTETISSATALALDVAGIAIVGLGAGSNRPTFTLDTANTTTIGVTAANISIVNCIFNANFLSIVSLFTVAAAKNFTVQDCLIKSNGTNLNFLNVVDTSAVANAADGLALINNKWIEPSTNTLSMVKADEDGDSYVIQGNYLNLGVKNSTASLVIAGTKALTNLICDNNTVYRPNTTQATGSLITTSSTACSGIVSNNFIYNLDATNGYLLVTAGSKLTFRDNKVTAAADTSGFLMPVADSV